MVIRFGEFRLALSSPSLSEEEVRYGTIPYCWAWLGRGRRGTWEEEGVWPGIDGRGTWEEDEGVWPGWEGVGSSEGSNW